jgi:hypothetical protein
MSIDRKYQENHIGTTNWPVVCAFAIIALAVGGGVGFFIGQQANKVSSDREIADKNDQRQSTAKQVKELQEQVDKIAKELIREKAKTKSAEDRLATVGGNSAKGGGARREGPISIDHNEQVLNFIDKPEKFTGKELTARVRYGSRENYFRGKLSLQERSMGGWDKDQVGNDLVPFFGEAASASRAKIDLIIGIPKDLSTPNAAPGDELLVTFKCGVNSKEGNVALRIQRPSQ